MMDELQNFKNWWASGSIDAEDPWEYAKAAWMAAKKEAAMNDQEYEEWKRANPGLPLPPKPRPE